MSEIAPLHIHSVFPEILYQIFVQLPVNDLMRCRSVCLKWCVIIDTITSTETVWRNHCRKDFFDICELAHRRSSPHLSWYHLYRSLKIWPKLGNAENSRRHFAVAECMKDEIQDFVLIDEVIGVHTKSKILYYDRNTLLNQRQRSAIEGNYFKYSETNDVLLLLNSNLTLSVTWKTMLDTGLNFAEPRNVSKCIVLENIIYYITIYRVLYKCELVDGRIISTEIVPVPTGAVALSNHNGFLHMLIRYTIYILLGEKLVVVKKLHPSKMSIFNELKKYNFLHQISWTEHFPSYSHFGALYPAHLTPCQEITTIFSYGLVTFAGNIYGKLYVFYTPEIDDLPDFFRAVPLKIYDFMVGQDYLTPTKCPIIQVDIVESMDSHIMFVATPKRITVVNIVHELTRTALSLNPRNISDFTG